MRRETSWFAGTTWIELWDDRSSEEIRRSDEIMQAQDEIRVLAEGEKRASQDSKKSWTDGVRWDAKQSLDELQQKIREWKRRKSLVARVKAEREVAEKASMPGLVGSARSSKESWTKSWSSGKSRLSVKQAKPAESGTNTSSVVKLKVRSRWARWQRWLSNFKKGLVLG